MLNTQSTVTGGARSNQTCTMLNISRWPLYGSIGTLSHELDSGGPLDAPCLIPCGAMNNTEWTRAGKPLPVQFEMHRDNLT